MKSLRAAFVNGLLILMPLIATIEVLRWFFSFIERGVRTYLPPLPFDFWGLGILLSVLVITVTGLLAGNLAATWIIQTVDRGLRRLPIVGGIYSGVKKFLEALFNPTNKQFKKAVLIEFPEPGVHSIGFMTGAPDGKIGSKFKTPMLNVFIPLVPNPISGFYVLVPAEKVTPLDMPVQEAFRMVISMGIVGSDS